MHNFKAYQLALRLYKEVKKLKLSNPVRDQLMRASLSVALNLAEGWGKQTPKDRKRFFTIALGSLRETQCLVDIIDNVYLIKGYDQLGALIWGLCRAT